MSVKITVSNVLMVEGLPQNVTDVVVRELTLPNPQFVTRQRLGKWLGDIEETVTLAERYEGCLVLPRGFLEPLCAMLKRAGLAWNIDDRRLKLPEIELQLRGELRPYQAEAMEVMTRHGSGVLIAPCGSGKTCIGAALIAHWRQPALILVHTRQLAKQTAEAIERWLGVRPGLIGEGVCDVQPVSVGIIQTLATQPDLADTLAERFGLVLLDEAHHCPATTFTDVLKRFPAAFRFGLTATPNRRDGLAPFMTAVIGPVRHEITAEDLRNAGVLVTPEIRWVPTGFFSGCDEWVDLMGALTEDQGRNVLVLNLIESLIDDGRRIIALSERVAHVERLAGILNGRRPGVAALITGTMGKKAREAAMQSMRNGEARVLFATRLADEGLDMPDLDALVLLTPSRDAGRTTQRAGRILRSVPGKSQPVIYDLVDASIGLLASQARTRFFECYRELSPGCRLPEWLESRRRAA